MFTWLVKRSLAFYGTRRFISFFVGPQHWILSHFNLAHIIFFKSTLILSSRLVPSYTSQVSSFLNFEETLSSGYIVQVLLLLFIYVVQNVNYLSFLWPDNTQVTIKPISINATGCGKAI